VSPLSSDEVLASLEVPRARPSRGFLELLFSRFVAKVPFESASKLAARRPRAPEEFWGEFLELGAGGTCFDRALAFDWLLGALGFERSVLLGRVEKDRDHGALRVDFAAESVLADVGFPLPALLSLPASRAASPLGQISVRSADETAVVVSFDEGPWSPRSVRIELAAAPAEAVEAARRATFAPGGPFLDHLALLRIEPRGALVYHKGRVRIDDAVSRATIPLSADRATALSELFGVDRDRLLRALEEVGDPNPAQERASIESYLDVAGEPEDRFANIAGVEEYRRLLAGLGAVRVVSAGAARFRVRLEGSDGPPVEEDVSIDADRRTLSIIRSAGSETLEGEYRAAGRDGGTRLVRSLRFSSARLDLLRNDSARRRIAAVLLADLLAWSRLAD
jgi:arylamine N-acetyltransferase